MLRPLIGSGGAAGPILSHRRVLLRPPLSRDYHAWARLRQQSRAFLEPWEPTWPPDSLSRSAYRSRLRHYERDQREGWGYTLFVLRRDDQELLGGITLGNLRRGVAQCCSLGYWMGEPHARQGYMSEALFATLDFAFGTLGLHRAEAACLPHNAASRGLLEKLGFREEGLARGYLRIAGRWQDHVLYAQLAEEFQERRGELRAATTPPPSS